MILQELPQVFSPTGSLAKATPEYKPRQAQLELAQAIENTINERGTLVAEAGTGTGKTWAYLIPSFLSGQKVLVSTGTRTLQDQLFHCDIPKLRSALQLSVNVALLKGRSNYVCHYHLDRMFGDDHTLRSRAEITQLRQIQVFTQQSQTGDKSELITVPENADIWHRVTSTRENCLGQECPFVRECFVLKARKKAQEADVVVVNHALYMADLSLREEGITDLLPSVDVVIFDEAHQLPDIATRFLGSSISSHQLLDLCKTIEAVGLAHAREATNWSEIATELSKCVREMRLQAAPIGQMPGRKATFANLPQAEEFDESIEQTLEALRKSIEALNAVQDAHPDLAAALNTAQELRARLFVWTQPNRQGQLAKGLEDTPENREAVRWVELSQNHLRLHRAPLSIEKLFARSRAANQAWVFTSATLSVNGNFNHFANQLGLGSATKQCWESPFEYAQQALLYVPLHMPLPNNAGFNQAFVDILYPLIESSSGGILVLCTTLRATEEIAKSLENRLNNVGSKRLLLRQGEESRGVLLDRFRTQGNAILVGSASFWEGVDVPGQALSVLAIDKLPFAPPDDPVLEARLNLCRSQGGNPFMEYQIPQAAITLKQGAGRLIRSELDKGVLLVGDTRLVDKPYGKLLWRGLPPFSRTREPSTAVEFLTSNVLESTVEK